MEIHESQSLTIQYCKKYPSYPFESRQLHIAFYREQFQDLVLLLEMSKVRILESLPKRNYEKWRIVKWFGVCIGERKTNWAGEICKRVDKNEATLVLT